MSRIGQVERAKAVRNQVTMLTTLYLWRMSPLWRSTFLMASFCAESAIARSIAISARKARHLARGPATLRAPRGHYPPALDPLPTLPAARS